MIAGKPQRRFWLLNLGHCGLREQSTKLELSFLLLPQQLVAHQLGDRCNVEEDANLVGAALDLLVDPLQRVDAPKLSQVLPREVNEREHLVMGGVRHGQSGGERRMQLSLTRCQFARS
jgi:hypothetical protein